MQTKLTVATGSGSSGSHITCQRGSARQCCKSHMHFKGKTSFLTPASPKTTHQNEVKIGMVHYVWGSNKYAKFHLAILRGFVSAHTWNITLLSFFIFIIFSSSRTARTKRPIFMVDGSTRAFWRKEVPFGGMVENWTKLGAWQPKNR